MFSRVKRLALAAALAASALSVSLPGTPAFAAPADSGATVTGEKAVRAQAFDITIQTPNIPAALAPKARILTPKGWSKNAARTWPVLYVYGGGADHYDHWDNITDLAAYAAAYDVLVVLPEGGVNSGYVDWFNNGNGGGPNWETFLTKDVVQIIERNYRGNAVRGCMAISSGASGCMTFAGRQRGIFKYVAAFSGIMHVNKAGIPAIMLWSDKQYQDIKNPEAKLGDPVRNRANWLEHDPYYLAENLRGVGLYISSGTSGNRGPLDPTWAELLKDNGGDPSKALQQVAVGNISERMVGSTAISLIHRLNALGIPVTNALYKDGLHNWPSWIREFHESWSLIMNALGVQKIG